MENTCCNNWRPIPWLQKHKVCSHENILKEIYYKSTTSTLVSLVANMNRKQSSWEKIWLINKRESTIEKVNFWVRKMCLCSIVENEIKQGTKKIWMDLSKTRWHKDVYLDLKDALAPASISTSFIIRFSWKFGSIILSEIVTLQQKHLQKSCCQF